MNTLSSVNSYPVIIVGAGLAGLTAARKLKENGVKTLVLEASDRVGGRTKQETIHGVPFPVGGQWISPMQKEIWMLVHEIGLKVFPTYLRGTKVLDDRGTITKYKTFLPYLGVVETFRLLYTTVAFEWKRWWSVDQKEPWASPCAEKLNKQTVADWMAPAPTLLRVCNAALRVIFGEDADQVSMLKMLSYANANHGILALLSDLQEYRIKGSIAEKLAENLTDLILNTPVTKISQDEQGVFVYSNDRKWRAEKVIVATPLNLIKEIAFEPELDKERKEFLSNTQMGSLAKVIVTFTKRFWIDRGLSGEVICTEGPVSLVFDNSLVHNDEEIPALVAFIGGSSVEKWEKHAPKEKEEIVLASLEKWFGVDARPFFRAYHEENWARARWSQGCPLASLPTLQGKWLQAPHGQHVYFASTETPVDQSQGFMNGAVIAGQRAAQKILHEQ
ncbi:MAG TPA: FAD-dependent oxidoreductase [Chlamydiales bacterium]|nr:FAD-dependent oxidoreductase [Chlamydiales bacterium]